jgi:hypothetical protein
MQEENQSIDDMRSINDVQKLKTEKEVSWKLGHYMGFYIF